MAIKPCFRQNLGIQGHNLQVILKLKGKTPNQYMVPVISELWKYSGNDLDLKERKKQHQCLCTDEMFSINHWQEVRRAQAVPELQELCSRELSACQIFI